MRAMAESAAAIAHPPAPAALVERAGAWLEGWRRRLSLHRRLDRGLLVAAAVGLGLEVWTVASHLRGAALPPRVLWSAVPVAGLLAALLRAPLPQAAAAARIDRGWGLEGKAAAYLEAGDAHPFRPWIAARLLAAGPVRLRYAPPPALMLACSLAFVAALPMLVPPPVEERLLPDLPRRTERGSFASAPAGLTLGDEEGLDEGVLLAPDEAAALLAEAGLETLADALAEGDLATAEALLDDAAASALAERLEAAGLELTPGEVVGAAGAAARDGGPGARTDRRQTTGLPRRAPLPDRYAQLVEEYFAVRGGR